MAKTGESTPHTTALITGASSGIGAELARVCAGHNHNLVLVARDGERLSALAGELQGQHGILVKVIVKDLALPASPAEVYDEVAGDSIPIDMLINNAGMIVYGEFSETELTRELQMIQVNLVSLTLLTKLYLKDMLKRGSGRILNLGSTGSFVPSPLNAVYSATKAYVLSFSEAIAEELAGTGVTVTALCPGAVKTELQKRAQMEDVRLLSRGVMDACTVAESGYRAMMAGRRVIVPGPANSLQVFATRFLPRGVVVKFSKAMLQKQTAENISK